MAQKGVNKVILIGRLGKEPEVKYMPSGDAVVNLSVATSENWKDKQSGEDVEKTEWHRLVCFGKRAEVIGKYMQKGDQHYFEGKLQTRKWQDRDGNDRYTTEIKIEDFQFLSKAGGGTSGAGRQHTHTPPNAADNPAAGPEDDIPF